MEQTTEHLKQEVAILADELGSLNSELAKYPQRKEVRDNLSKVVKWAIVALVVAQVITIGIVTSLIGADKQQRYTGCMSRNRQQDAIRLVLRENHTVAEEILEQSRKATPEQRARSAAFLDLMTRQEKVYRIALEDMPPNPNCEVYR